MDVQKNTNNEYSYLKKKSAFLTESKCSILKQPTIEVCSSIDDDDDSEGSKPHLINYKNDNIEYLIKFQNEAEGENELNKRNSQMSESIGSQQLSQSAVLKNSIIAIKEKSLNTEGNEDPTNSHLKIPRIIIQN